MNALNEFYWLTVLLLPLAALAQKPKDLSELYDKGTLEYWHTRYPISTQRIFNEGMLPVFNVAEKRVLANIDLQFPLRPTGEYYGDPLALYAGGNTVTMPISSLKFFDDLCVAYAWLWANDYSLETVNDYVAMLKYSDPEKFSGGRYPQPLKALHIPENALQNPKVDELALRFFNSARAFMLAHELGHIYHRHPGYGPNVTKEQARENETEADEFALDIMRRAATIPMGMGLFFQATACWLPNRWDFESEEAWEAYQDTSTHPLNADRLESLAIMLNEADDDFTPGRKGNPADREIIRFIAMGIADVAQWLKDLDLQHSMVISALETTPAALAPRHRGERSAPPTAANKPERKALPAFQGTYVGKYIRYVGSDQEDLSIRVIFQRSGERVTGQYNFGLGVGTIRGTIRNNTLYFEWQWGGTYGRGTMQATEQGRAFSGKWGYRESSDNGGEWSGRRQ